MPLNRFGQRRVTRVTAVSDSLCPQPTGSGCYVGSRRVRYLYRGSGIDSALLLSGAEFLLETVEACPTVSPVKTNEHILVEHADEPQIGPISESLASVLIFLEKARGYDQLAQKLIDEGAAARECDELISDFLEHGWIQGQVFTPSP